MCKEMSRFLNIQQTPSSNDAPHYEIEVVFVRQGMHSFKGIRFVYIAGDIFSFLCKAEFPLKYLVYLKSENQVHQLLSLIDTLT